MFEAVYANILSQFEYTMSELEEVEDGKCKATITYKPFALGDALDDTAMSFYEQNEQERLEGEHQVTRMFDDELFRLLADKAGEFAEDVKYSE